MGEQPHKPGGDFNDEGKPRKPAERSAVENQGEAEPDDYPEPAAGEKVAPKR